MLVQAKGTYFSALLMERGILLLSVFVIQKLQFVLLTSYLYILLIKLFHIDSVVTLWHTLFSYITSSLRSSLSSSFSPESCFRCFSRINHPITSDHPFTLIQRFVNVAILRYAMRKGVTPDAAKNLLGTPLFKSIWRMIIISFHLWMKHSGFRKAANLDT